MSLLTQCPACETYYRVVPDQLRISDGWVKCGNCSDIFDASSHLIELDASAQVTDSETQLDFRPEAPVLTPPNDLRALGLDLPDRPASDNASPQSDLPAHSEQPEQHEYDVPRPSDMAEPQQQIEPIWASPETEVDATSEILPQLVFPEDESTRLPGIAQDPQSVRWDDAVPLAPEAIPLAPVSDVSDEPVTFLRDEPPMSAWQKPLVRGALVFCAFGLLLLLAGQWAYRERDKLAASHSDLKPALQKVCAWIGCEIRPVQHIEALLIDSVAFNKLDIDTYKLSFLVKNTSHLPLAYPAIELVLTDAEDQPAYRRVLSSLELGSRAKELAPNADWVVSVPLRIDSPLATQRVFGYRLLVFYP